VTLLFSDVHHNGAQVEDKEHARDHSLLTLILRITQLEELRHGILIGADLVASIMIKQRRDDLDEILEQS